MNDQTIHPASASRTTDPVCGMTVDPATSKHRAEHAGKTFYFCCNGCREKFAADPDRYLKAAPATDPVCGMTVDPATAKHQAEHGGKTFYFCSDGCRTKFLADPGRYLKPPPPRLHADAPPAPAAAGTIYTCPMHPEMRQIGPGSCPICGMALEPPTPPPRPAPTPNCSTCAGASGSASPSRCPWSCWRWADTWG